jgi:hypothetical protein
MDNVMVRLTATVGMGRLTRDHLGLLKPEVVDDAGL